MLNLLEIKEEYFEVKLSEEQGVLHLRKPSKALYDSILKLTSNINAMSDTQEYDETMNLSIRILNRNIEGVEFKKGVLNYTQADKLVSEYTMWIIGFLKANSKN